MRYFLYMELFRWREDSRPLVYQGLVFRVLFFLCLKGKDKLYVGRKMLENERYALLLELLSTLKEVNSSFNLEINVFIFDLEISR